jgi:hypothetical protein
VKQGDTTPALTGVLLHPDLSIADLTDARITLQLLHMETHGLIRLPAAVMDDPLCGVVVHYWRAGETNVSGAYFYHWIVRWGDRQETFPNDRRGRILSIEAVNRNYAAVPRRVHFLCGDTGGQGCLMLDPDGQGLEIDLKTVPGRLRGSVLGQGSTSILGGIGRSRRGLIGRGRLSGPDGQEPAILTIV